MTKTNETIEIDPHGEHHGKAHIGFLQPEGMMTLLTWISFFLIFSVLYKFAWKPILAALANREDYIKKSLDDADKIKEEMESLQEKTQKMLEQAQAESKEIVDKARKAAVQAASVINAKARDDAQILVDNARREIQTEVEKAQSNLREESAQIAVELAGKILEENLDPEKNRKLINHYIKEL